MCLTVDECSNMSGARIRETLLIPELHNLNDKTLNVDYIKQTTD